VRVRTTHREVSGWFNRFPISSEVLRKG